MIIVTESEFKRKMKDECPSSFSEEALTLIYADLKKREKEDDKEIRFTPLQVDLEYEEWSHSDFMEEYGIKIEKLAIVVDSLDNISPYEQAIKDHLGSDFVGFTSEETVVYLAP